MRTMEKYYIRIYQTKCILIFSEVINYLHLYEFLNILYYLKYSPYLLFNPLLFNVIYISLS